MWFLFGNVLNQKTSEEAPPKVWALLNHRAGENTQVLALAEALGWPFEIKRFTYRKGVPYLLLSASLAGIDIHASDPLNPPWPDLIVSASARNEPICRWIQKQAAQSGHRVRLVHIGRPFNPLNSFDLVITTPQYRLPNRSNVLQNSLTLHRVTRARLENAAEIWYPQLNNLPKPYFAVMIGGSSGPFCMDRRAVQRLAGILNQMVNEQGGSLLITTSARTPASLLDQLKPLVTVPAHWFDWSQSQGGNPYYGYLALADQIVVTGDSVSMLSEACATGKPVHIFNLAEDSISIPWQEWTREHLRAKLYRWAMNWGPRRITRDLSLVHDRVIAEGRAVWLGDPFPSELPRPAPADQDRAVARVRALFQKRKVDLARENLVRCHESMNSVLPV